MAEIYNTSLFSDPTLQGYWRVEDNWNDSGPNAYHLTPNNSPTFVTGKYGKAGNFVKASSQSATCTVGASSNIEISGSQTWACWIKPTTIDSYQCPMNLSESDGSKRRGFVVDADVGNSIGFELDGLTTNNYVGSTEGAIADGVVAHVAGVYNGSTLKIYINGIENNSVTASGSPSNLSNAGAGFALGARGGTVAFYNSGWVDDGVIFSKALTAAEILTLYQEQSASHMMWFT